MQTQSSDENSVRLSVCPSVRPSVRPSNAWIVTKRKKNLFRFLDYTKDHLAQFSEKNMVGGGDPFSLGQPARVGAKSPILNRYSLIAPQP